MGSEICIRDSYLADDANGKLPVALKVPRPEVLDNEEELRRFKDEAIAIAKLDHPGVVKLLGYKHG